MSTKATRRARKRLLHAQEGLCGLCWLPLTSDLSTDHILPQRWYKELGKSESKHQEGNLQAAHTHCNKQKANYPSPWHRHSLRFFLARIRGTEIDEEALLVWNIAGEKPVSQNTPLRPGPEWIYPKSSGLQLVPYVHKYFNDQGFSVPDKIRRDQFEPQFAAWMQQEPMRTWHQTEQAIMREQAHEMWQRALEHELRCSADGYVRGTIAMKPGFAIPEGSSGPPLPVRRTDHAGIEFEGFLWPTSDPLTFAVSRHRDDKPEEAIDQWHSVTDGAHDTNTCRYQSDKPTQTPHPKK